MENLLHQINDSGDALSLSFSLSQKYTIIYLNNNSESEYLKKRNKFLSNSFQLSCQNILFFNQCRFLL